MPFVAALSLNESGRPTHLKLDVVSGFTSPAIGKRAKTRLAPGGVVLRGGLGCFAAVTDAGCIHLPRVVGTFKRWTCPSSSGSTPCWATSRPHCPARSTR